MRGRGLWPPALGFAAAIVPILSKSVGGDEPQFPVTKSTRFKAAPLQLTLHALATCPLAYANHQDGDRQAAERPEVPAGVDGLS
jgi:hypothetical protein